MRRFAAAFALLSALTLSVRAQPSTILIHGRVLSGDTGDALPHARIVIYNDATPLPAIFSDGQGRFAAAPLPPGRYRLAVTKAGYALTSAERVGDRATSDGVDVRMPRSSAVAGHVVDRFGDPSAAVLIQLFMRAPDRSKVGALVKNASTDDLGEYRFGGLPEGTYVVGTMTQQQDRTGQFNRTVTYYPGVTSIADAEDVVLRPGDERSGVDFTGIGTQANEITVGAQIVPQPGNLVLVGPNGFISPTSVLGTGVIRGRVTRADGLPVVRATVSTQAPQTIGRNQINGVRLTHTDDDGRYELGELPAGQYRVIAAKLGYTTFIYGQRGDEDRGTPVDLADGQISTRIDIALPRQSAVMGRVVDEFGDPVENVAVALSQMKFQAGRRRLVAVSGMSGRTTDDLGRYRIYAVPRGEYVVNASVGQVVPGQPGTGQSGYAPTYFPGTTNPREAQVVSVPRSQDVTGVDFVMLPTPTATISGKKLGSDGRPLGGSLVLTPSQRSGAIVTPPTGARIYDDGRFEFPNVPPGDYVIQADPGKPSAEHEGEFVMAFVTVNGEDVPDVLLQATPGSTISGRVVFEGDGPSVPALTITTSRADLDRTPLSGGSIAQGEVGADLRFAMTGIHGPRRLTLGRAPSGWTLKSIVANGVDVTDVPLPFGAAEQSLSDVQVVVTNQVAELSGTAMDSRGNASTDYTLLVFPVDRERWYSGSRYFRRAGPAQAGNFTVRGLPASDYFVAAVARFSVLRDGDDAWQDPDFLESIALRAARATLTEGQKLSVSPRIITP
jgi:hypothetical protein